MRYKPRIAPLRATWSTWVGHPAFKTPPPPPTLPHLHMPPSPSFLAAGDPAAAVVVVTDHPSAALHTTSSDEIHSCSDDSAATADDGSAGLLAGLSLQSLPSVPSLQRLCPSPSPSSAASSRLLFTLRPSPAPISALAVSTSAGLLYAASGEQVRAWDLSSLSEVAAFNLSGDGAVKSLAFAGDGSVFTAHQDRRIRVWRPENVEPTADLRSFRHRLVATLPTVSDRLLRGVWPKNYVRVRRHRRRLWVEHADAVSGLAVVGDGLVYSVSWDRTLKVWRAKDLRCVESVAAHDDAVNAVAVAGDGTVFTGSADGRIRVWRKDDLSKKHNLVATLERHRSAVNALALGGGDVLYSGAGDRSILVWEREETASYMAVAGALRGHRGAVLCLAGAGEEAAVMVSGSEDRTVRVWRRQGEEADGGRRYDCLAVLEGHGRAVRAVVVVAAPAPAEGFTVCSGSLDGEIRIWKIGINSSSSTKHDTNQSFNGTDYKLIR